VPRITEGRGEPILNPVTGTPHRVRIDMVDGFEYSLAEIGRGWTKTARPIKLELIGGFRPDAFGSLALGAVMNVLWIVAVTIFVLVEKMLPVGHMISRLTGAGFFASGVWVLAQTL
jgi:hypothetical protein